MPSTQEPNGGLYYGWTLSESGWNLQVDSNWKKLSRLGFAISVIDRGLSAPPGTPADGDTYIVGPTATGAWATYENSIAVWDSNLSAWVIYAPQLGWLAYIQDEEVLSAYKAAGWSAGVAI